MKADQVIIDELRRLVREFQEEVAGAQTQDFLTPSTAKTYTYHSTQFLNWCLGDFEPGERNKHRKQGKF